MDDKAFDFLASFDSALQKEVMSNFRPRKEDWKGEEDYSALITSYVRLVQQKRQRGQSAQHGECLSGIGRRIEKGVGGAGMGV